MNIQKMLMRIVQNHLPTAYKISVPPYVWEFFFLFKLHDAFLEVSKTCVE